MVECKIDAKGLTIQDVSKKVKKAVEKGEKVIIKNAKHVHGICSGLEKGSVIIKGDCGDYVGSVNSGATITVDGNSGNFIADNMTEGKIIVNGDAGYGAGQYCYGGLVVIKGNAGDFSGTMNKGAAVIITGNVGNEVGTYMVGGDIVVLGNTGKELANFLICGNVYIAGKWESLGHNTNPVEMTEEDISKLSKYFKEGSISANPKDFKKIIPLTDKPFYKGRD
jgi:glutamate synthase domain-containing protein 3